MRLKACVIGIILMMTGTAASAQQCGNGLPCGPIPWELIELPALSSPTPAPAVDSSAAVGSTEAAAIGVGPQLNTTNLNNQVATLSGMIYATPIAAQNLDGSYNSAEMDATQEAELAANAGTFFGYVRGLSAVSFGVLTPLISFALLAFGVIFALKVSTFVIPVFMVLFGFFRRIISLILDFIPL